MVNLVKQLIHGAPECSFDLLSRRLPAMHRRAIVQLCQHAAQLLQNTHSW